MRCESCDFENPVAMKFCGECGAPLKYRCPQCGFENPPQFKFCGACGTSLTEPPQAQRALTDRLQDVQEAQPIQVVPPSVERNTAGVERRQLTVLFCDLVDSTPLAVKLDPEELREVIRAYQRVCAEVIEPFGGHVAQYLGDGLLVYFSYPQAHEDDGQRAVRAALGMLRAIQNLNQHLEQKRGVKLEIRVGIHTGLVVVGEMGGGDRQEQLALGETPNVAARLQSFAAPDTVVISAATHRLVRRSFACQELGSLTLKGVATPLQVFRIMRERGALSHFGWAASRGLTPLVGREQELGLLLERWAQVRDGLGQVVLLSGEAGIGKSRLVQAVTERVARELHTRLESRGSPYDQHSALYPVMELLHRLLRWRHDDGPPEKVHKLETALERYGFSLLDTVPLFASLLALQLPDRYPPLALTPQRQKQKTLETLLLWVLRETEKQPVLLIVEDLHWLDPSTLEFLNLVMDQAATMRLFALLTFRPTFRPPWTLHAHVTHLTLSRLSPHQTALMVERMVGGKALPVAVRQELIAKTDGVPLFVEELTKMVLESGWLRETSDRYELHGPLPPLAIPSTLHDSLMARLDRLATAKPVAQLGATIGRQFSHELLGAVSSLGETALQQALGQLVETELVHQRGLPPQATYVFKHTLIQEAAYQSLVRSTRYSYHQRIAQVLAEQFPQVVETQPELLAHHYTEAGLSEQAVPYWQQAGQRAIERSANIEAIGHLTKALELLKTLPATPQRIQQELALQLAVGSPLLMLRGHTAPEVEQAYLRAEELCQQVGDSPQRCAALVGLWRFHLGQARFQICRELAERCFRLAQRLRDTALLQEAEAILGSTLFYLGELGSARAHLEQGIALDDPHQSRFRAFSGGRDPMVTCLCWTAWTLWLQGYPDRALTRMHEALTLAERLSHMYSLGFALYFASTLHMWRREVPLVQEKLDAVMALSRDQGFARWLGGGMIKQGWILVEQGAAEAGIAPIRQGLATWRATAGELGLPGNLARLAEACGKAGHTEEGLQALDEALAIVHKNGERYNEAELYRLQGELLLLQAAPDEQQAERAFHRALDVARHQQARSWELRAALSLCRLWQKQGKREEPRQMLARLYDWFTEGFDTADLQEAKGLLDALA
jgi:predicted ATPase/class 3 adenylate cyclase